MAEPSGVVGCSDREPLNLQLQFSAKGRLIAWAPSLIQTRRRPVSLDMYWNAKSKEVKQEIEGTTCHEGVLVKARNRLQYATGLHL